MTAIGRPPGPKTSKQSGMPMKPTLLYPVSRPSMLALATRRPRQRLRAKPSANVAAMPPLNARAKPVWLTCSGVILDIVRNIKAGSAR